MSIGVIARLGGAAVMAANLAHPALADTAPASLYIVHGIPGRDVAPSLPPALPVDVLVNDKLCLLKNFTFGTVAGPFQLPAGSYGVAVSVANPLVPCGNPAVFKSTVALGAGQTAAGVAALTPTGKPTIEPFLLDFSSVFRGTSRLVIAHAAAAPSVVAKVIGQNGVGVETVTIAPDTLNAAIVPSSATTGVAYSISVQTTAGAIVTTPLVVSAPNQGAALVFVVGSATTGSVTLINQTVRSVE